MQAIDQYAIRDCGIPGVVLMENAGIETVECLWQKFPDLAEKKVLVFSGKGNNGGDGFAAARRLFNQGVDVQVFLLGRRTQLKQDARVNADIAFNIGLPVREVDEQNIQSIDHSLRHGHIVIDAIFGTGLHTAASGLYERVIEKINAAAGKYVVSIDLPSGLDSDTGRRIGPHVRANLTVALALLKRSHLLFPAAEAMGEVQVVDISIPQKAVESQPVAVNLVEEEDIRSLFKARPADSHKGLYGHVLVIAGSRGKGGAAGLAGLAALRAGAGLATLALPEGLCKSVEFSPLETMTLPLPETKNGSFALAASETLLEQCRGKSSVAIGPGLSTDPESVALLEEILPKIECPLVIDADGLNCLALSKGLLGRLKSPTVLTPHPKEMARISGRDIRDILEKRIEIASEFASVNSVCLILKGGRALAALSDGTVYVNSTGNSGMATAGTGDVLTGMVAGLLAQGFDVKSASISASYLHGLAGDIFARENSETSLIAGDLLRNLPESMKRILP